ncbi:MAG: DNRLRE domain-containing protein [Ignavibacteriales bacterium]|nr:DNRLRE domain-containing protein [Ignavibacteriales bacterium]
MKYLLIVPVLIIVLFLSGCSEDPNPVGLGLLPKSDYIKIDTTTFFATQSSSQRWHPVSSNRLLIGKYKDVESWGIFRFVGIPDTLQKKQFVSAQLMLRANYHFGDSLAPFSVAAHQVYSTWGDSLTLDSLKAANFYNATPMSQSSVTSIGDTDFFYVSIDTNLVRKWITTGGDSAGVLLRPTNSNVVKGFGSGNNTEQVQWPKLMLRVFRTGSTAIDTVLLTGSVARFAAGIANTTWASDSAQMYVRNGLSYRGIAKFDVSSLPRHAAIHRAILEVTLNRSLSQLNSFSADSLYAYFVAEGKILDASYILSERSDVNGFHRFSFSIGPFVQQWVRSAEDHSIAIGGYTETNAVDVFALYGSAAAAGLKPKLTVIYSIVR